MRIFFGAAIALCCLGANAPVCTNCSTETVRLALGDGTALSGRLYLPRGGATTLPAVLVIPGYLANTGFVEVPWAADLTDLGMAALFLDRRGHGRSGGNWWPTRRDGDVPLREFAPDVGAAVTYLRGRAPLVDSGRIALLGHSDGGTAAIMAASADWDIGATVSVSASVAPWEYVNHVAPRDLLLVYGGDDRFILADTDLLLIDAATRGYLHGEGQVGSLGDGSARRLLRVDRYGHLNVLYSAAARREALTWLAGAMGIQREARLSPLRWRWVVAGLLSMWLLVLAWNGVPVASPAREQWLIRGSKAAIIVILWTAGLFLASWVGPRLRGLPVQEGNSVAGLMLGACASMGALAIWLFRRRHLHEGVQGSWFHDLWRGAIAGLLVQLTAELILRPVYGFTLGGPRLALSAIFLLLAFPAFSALCAATRWLPNGLIVRGVAVELVLGGITAALATEWFVRMSALPVVLLACTLAFVAAYRASGGAAIGAAAFGAVMYARAAADVCAFY